MSRKRDKPVRIVRPCCTAAADITPLLTGTLVLPHRPHCRYAKRPPAREDQGALRGP